MAALALIDKGCAVIYVDTTNYINAENMNLVVKVSANG